MMFVSVGFGLLERCHQDNSDREQQAQARDTVFSAGQSLQGLKEIWWSFTGYIHRQLRLNSTHYGIYFDQISKKKKKSNKKVKDL